MDAQELLNGDLENSLGIPIPTGLMDPSHRSTEQAYYGERWFAILNEVAFELKKAELQNENRNKLAIFVGYTLLLVLSMAFWFVFGCLINLIIRMVASG